MKFKISSLGLAFILAMATFSRSVMASNDCIVNYVQYLPEAQQLVLGTSAGGSLSGGCSNYRLTFTDVAKLDSAAATALTAKATRAHIDFNAYGGTLTDISINRGP